ncbi:group-specific protein [Sporosarcina sp. FSL K6-3457]|uniref:group-specific protein n=1 Tax=Sporosarcina sp. FSL K6-3457 TaxID=2978204 RepID=UPI0030FC5588
MHDINEMENNSFIMEVNAPYSLNYLVFMQNIFENSKNSDGIRPLFPYVDSSRWGLLQNENFTNTFREIWNEVIGKNKRLDDHSSMLENENTLYQRLFENNENGRFGYSESIKLFLSWWDGIYGNIAIQKVFDDESMNKIYWELSKLIEPTTDITITRRLKIDLVYDQQLLKGKMADSWYVVVPIEDIFVLKPQLVPSLLKSCEITE